MAFKVAIRSERAHCPVEPKLAAKVRVAAQKRGISAETLVNLWLQERLPEASKARGICRLIHFLAQDFGEPDKLMQACFFASGLRRQLRFFQCCCQLIFRPDLFQ